MIKDDIIKWIESSCKKFQMPNKYPNPCKYNYIIKAPNYKQKDPAVDFTEIRNIDMSTNIITKTQ